MANDDLLPHDHRALAGLVRHGGALCTIVGIDGSFSRRCGAQLAVHGDGTTSGDLADSCLEAALAQDARLAVQSGTRRLVRYGKGSHMIDFSLPCGGGLDILIDPDPDRSVCAAALDHLEQRRPVRLLLPLGPKEGALALIDDNIPPEVGKTYARDFIPAMRLIVAGAGPEPTELSRLAATIGIETILLLPIDRSGEGELSLGQPPQGIEVDPWTAIILLFHDHEWEEGLLRWALTTRAMMIGAQGGEKARESRGDLLDKIGCSATQKARVRGPIGLIPSTRDPKVLALSVLAEAVACYEQLLAD